jgi:hypothetical protein
VTLEEHIVQKLSERFPGKVFKVLGGVDSFSYQPVLNLSINGKATQWSLPLETVNNQRALHGFNDEKIAYDFAQTVNGIAHL